MNQRTPTLLYIDDDAALARLVERGLTRRGYKVVHAASGEEGLARIRRADAQGCIEGCIDGCTEDCIDVVALDQYMPGLDGLETLEQIMAIPGAPPVVFVTASQDSNIAVTALKAGAADYLVKDVKGDFIPLLQVAADGALRQAELQKAREAAEAEIHASRDRYAALAAERELLLREVNHRVGNSLQIIASLLHLQASSATQEEVKAALTNAMGRVAAVAQVHRRLYTSQDLKSVVLNQYLDSLLEDLRRSAEGNRMSRLTLKAEPIEINPDRAVAVGIIVNELVMNAVKYAYPDGAGPIHVELTSRGEELMLSIADDGVGDNAKVDPRSTGMGQRIVAAMAAKLDASVERDPAHTGTKILLKFRRVPASPGGTSHAAAS
ncbi:response regulator [Bradyrhizobium sp. 186]|uniref:sensor histidine kinase n=1 Tax=Bradyrhizobium sp. 186 TaxID=2782654 RepID=UPI002000BE62|nr:histidine kinase dimerization/phosphoacceptor domain -containing protein [Bradyrhizobium sp. 186]UPK39929.1 response regulator [Bradyrhizobium sp. 186]